MSFRRKRRGAAPPTPEAHDQGPVALSPPTDPWVWLRTRRRIGEAVYEDRDQPSVDAMNAAETARVQAAARHLQDVISQYGYYWPGETL